MTHGRATRRVSAARRNRRGAALLATLMLLIGFAAVAATASLLGSNATVLSASYDREADLRFAAEAALAIGKSRLNFDALALPDSGYATLLSGAPLTGADGQPIPGITLSVHAGPTGSTTGQFGRFASVVAEARDQRGARFLRRLELAQESFARYAYWSNRESNNGQTIYFGAGDNLWGPVWSNDIINIHSTGATFHGDVGTARTINGVPYGRFLKGYATNQQPITLPSTASLARLPGYAAAGSLSFTAPTSDTSVVMRLEFVAVDLNADGDSTDADEGFLRVYQGDPGSAGWVRGDWNSTKLNAANCGAFYTLGVARRRGFIPAAKHEQQWFRDSLVAGGMSTSAATTISNAGIQTIMQQASARCFLGGDPNLVTVERDGSGFTTAQKQKSGSDTTFTAAGVRGHWLAWPGPVDARLSALRPYDAAYLFPLYRGLNGGVKGVIYVDGTVGVSGVLRGKVTIYASRIIALLDDLRYASDPASGRCADILGIISGRDIVISDNAILGPPDINPSSGAQYRNLDDTKDVYLHGVLMALSTSVTAQRYNLGPTNANGCEGSTNGRGCLYLTGGLIQESRGAVGTTGGTGYIKRYSYDRCAVASPPPYFPTTGRFTDNRFYEIDPVRFTVADIYRSLVPAQ